MLVILLLFLLPIAEITVFIQVGSRIGAGMTLLLVIAGVVGGIWLVRIQGFATAVRVQGMIARGESPAQEMLEGLALLVAGVLLVIPGFLTDIAAFILLIPPLRRSITRYYLRFNRVDGGTPPPLQPGSGKAVIQRPPLEGQSRRED